MFTLESGAAYFGQVNKDNLPEGRGIAVMKDGSLYEGFWLNGKQNGAGRYIYGSSGNVRTVFGILFTLVL